MAANYKITSQSQTQELSPTGMGFQDMWNIMYQVTDGPSKGTVASIKIPEADHNADEVRSQIEAKISDLDAIASLGSN